jgi:beta-galactosidase
MWMLRKDWTMLRNLLPASRVSTPFVGQASIIHGGDYNPDQWLPMHPDILEEDAKLMQVTGINSASIGIFAWASLEPTEGHFSFDWLDRVMDQQAAIGNKVILATPTGAMPTWLAEKYPETRRVDKAGHRAIYGRRHNHCWSSPAFHERTRIINTLLAERYKGHPALAMWHISNELQGECFCDLCRKWWHSWLEKKYGTIKAMNDAHWAYFWAHQAGDWRHVEPTDYVMDGMALDWLRFANDQLIDWYQFEANILRPITPIVPITTNFMGVMHQLNYQAISRVVDVVTDDQYPSYDPDKPDFIESAIANSLKQDLYRCFKPERTHMLMESCPGIPQYKNPPKAKRPGVHRLEMLQAVAHGADGTCYFQFRSGRGSTEKLHGSVVEHWGAELHTQTRRYRELRELSDTYDKLAGVLGTTVQAEVALVYDWESRWGHALSGGTMGTGGTKRVRYLYDQIAVEQYRHFWSRGIPVDVISDDRDFSKYKLLILPLHWIVTEAFAAKLKTYVEQGGTLVATWDTGMADEHNRMLLGGWPGNGLQEVFGLWVEEIDRLPDDTPRTIKGLPGRGGDVAAIAHLTTAKAVATFVEDFYSGGAAVTRNKYGKGTTHYIGTRLDEKAGDAFYGGVIKKLGLKGVTGGSLPTGVLAQIRGAGDEAYLFLLNFSKSPKKIQAKLKLKDIESGKTFRGAVTLAPLAAKVYRVTK